MAKDPAFLFYPGDWIAGTMGMTLEEKGAYMELLMAQFNQGHMTTHMVGRMVGQLWVNIQHKFVQDGEGKWYNVRLESEQLKRKQFTDSRKNNLTGKNQHKKKRGHTTSRMENENVNENIVDNDNGIENRKTDFHNSLQVYSGEFSESTINDFFNYWTEPNKKGKMRFEGEKYFYLGRRLATWKKNESKFNNGKNADGTIKSKVDMVIEASRTFVAPQDE